MSRIRRDIPEGERAPAQEEIIGLLSSHDASQEPQRRPSPIHSNSTSSSKSSSRERPPGGLSIHPPGPRTPRTPNRVRFDLTPTFVPEEARQFPAVPPKPTPTNEDTHHHARASFDYSESDTFNLDDDDYLSSSSTARRGHQRVPLLSDITAPSIAVASDRSLFGDHADAEDWHASEASRPKSNLSSAFMNMANSIIGAGIIGQPYAFKSAGLLSGTLLLVVLTVVVDWTICLIVINSKLSGASSFQGTVEKCFGKPGLIAISVAQWAFAFGGMVAFGVIVGDSIPNVMKAIWPDLAGGRIGSWLVDRRVVIVVFTLGVSWPLALYRDIAKLAKASTFALVSMGVIVLTVVVQVGFVEVEERGEVKGWEGWVLGDGIWSAIGVISFAFVCHHNSLLIYGSLEKPTIDRFSKVTHYSTAISMFACLLMALAGFLTFGDKTQGNVLNNFPADNTMVNIARLCFGLNMLTTLPLEAFVCREVMLNYYFPGDPFNLALHLIFTSSLVFSAMTLSLLTCDLGTVFDLVGGTSAAAMAYILPPLCYIKLTKKSWRTWVAWGVVGFGGVVMGMSMVQALGKMISGMFLFPFDYLFPMLT
ncbi:hypothetical protein QC762_307080 [Podospora pseudocomata]|uniref:Amino acid transporter transmembrane domain-containing protein n=1 Tax=Podospora pseudocomata TaxID=2093779 RepID=A0ABR0GJY0_9PEZI|nr:hypothetical protein QC762_307080 [Podospora pseudocomata]